MIGTEDINNGSVTTDKIADGAITSEKIGDGEVNTQDLADGAVTSEKIKDGEVKTADIADGAVTPEKLSDRIVPEVIVPIVKKVDDKYKGITDDLQNQIDSLEISGLALSNNFGDDPHIGISQKTLTDAFNKVWAKIEDITGESLLGFQMAVTPEYYIGEEGSNIHVTATTVDTVGVFEEIRFLINGIQIWPTTEEEGKNVSYAEFDTEISETSVVECDAKILGIPYSKQAIITHYSSFWLGAGSTYTDVMKNSNLRPITNNMRGAYNIDVASGQKIIIVLGESLREGFIRADINGVEIAFVETTQTVDGNTYKVLTSENTYQAGTYNIDING